MTNRVSTPYPSPARVKAVTSSASSAEAAARGPGPAPGPARRARPGPARARAQGLASRLGGPGEPGQDLVPVEPRSWRGVPGFIGGPSSRASSRAICARPAGEPAGGLAVGKGDRLVGGPGAAEVAGVPEGPPGARAVAKPGEDRAQHEMGDGQGAVEADRPPRRDGRLVDPAQAEQEDGAEVVQLVREWVPSRRQGRDPLGPDGVEVGQGPDVEGPGLGPGQAAGPLGGPGVVAPGQASRASASAATAGVGAAAAGRARPGGADGAAGARRPRR